MFKQLMAMFHVPSPELLAQEELEDARRELLVALSAQEYAKAQVQYNTERVDRLTKTVGAAK